MKQDFSAAFLWVALAFAVAIGMAMWGALANLGAYEIVANGKYQESVQLDRRAMKTIVLVDGIERDDCILQRGASTIICAPPLTPEQKKHRKHRNNR